MLTILQKVPDLLPRTRYSIWDERMPSFCLKAATRSTMITHLWRQRMWMSQFATRLGRAIASQKEKVLQDLEDGKLVAGEAFEKRGRVGLLKIDIKFDENEWDQLIGSRMRGVYADIVSDYGERAGRLAGGARAFNLHNRAAAQYLRQVPFRFAREINRGTRDALQRELAEAIERGETIDQVRDRIEATFKHIQYQQGYRAIRTARTEVNGASNFGLVEGYRQRNVRDKRWLVGGRNVRDSHQALNNKVVETTESWDMPIIDHKGRRLGTEKAEYPGDMSLSPGNRINCKCAVAPVIRGRRRY